MVVLELLKNNLVRNSNITGCDFILVNSICVYFISSIYINLVLDIHDNGWNQLCSKF